jgi:2-alkyl-3-oxoalkanoate reductase
MAHPAFVGSAPVDRPPPAVRGRARAWDHPPSTVGDDLGTEERLVRVLITGATGFVGGRVARCLRERDDEVVALVRSPADRLAAWDVAQHVGELTDVATLTPLLADVDAVVHAAASLDDDLAAARRVNRGGTAAVVDAALQAGVRRLVHVSTTSVYDRRAAGDAEISETHALVTSGSAYALTKAEAEAEVARGVAAGLDALVLRPPAVLGAGATSTWGTHVPRRVRDRTLSPRDPAATFAWVHVEDLVDAVLAGVDTSVDATVNVVGGHTTFGVYLDRIAQIVGAVPSQVTGTSAPPGWRGQLATGRLGAVLGVRPRRRFDEALDEIAAAWDA